MPKVVSGGKLEEGCDCDQRNNYHQPISCMYPSYMTDCKDRKHELSIITLASTTICKSKNYGEKKHFLGILLELVYQHMCKLKWIDMNQ